MIDAQGLQLDFPGRSLFKGLDLRLKKGEVLSLLGPSGCGKSTLLRILMKLIAPTRGEVRGLPESFGAVFQEPRLLPWRTVRENLLLPLELKGQKANPAEVEAAVRRVKLEEKYLQLFPHQLSGGMKMRVALARSLITTPDCLFLDEPFSALDERTRFELQDLLVSLLRPDRSAVFVTHSISEAVFLSDRVLILNHDGQIRDEYSKPAALKSDLNLRESLSYFETIKDLSRRFAEAQS